MDIASILLILAVAVLVAMYVSRPFFSRTPLAKNVDADPRERELSALLAERDRLLTALQELEFDQALGKIPAEDYPEQRAALLAAGAEVYRKLDEMEESTPATSAEDRLEAAVATRRADAAAHLGKYKVTEQTAAAAISSAAKPEDDLEAQIAARRSRRQEKSAGFCPGCGNPVQKSDRFCPRCGKTL